MQAEWSPEWDFFFAFSQIINRPNLFKFRHYQIVLQNILHLLCVCVCTRTPKAGAHKMPKDLHAHTSSGELIYHRYIKRKSDI